MSDAMLDSIISRFAGKRVLVIGDVMIDEYVWGNARRISPEAPVMVVQVERESYMPGGAANVVNNIQALGAEASMVGVIGDDEHGLRLRESLNGAGVDAGGLVVDSSRPTTRKTRIVAHSQQVVRVDREYSVRLRPSIAGELISMIERRLPDADVVVFSDYDKGVACGSVVRAAIEGVRNIGKRLVANLKPGTAKRFKGASVVTVNQSEAEAISRVSIAGDRDLERASARIMNSLKPEALVITRGPRGMRIVTDGAAEDIAPHLVEVYDAAGAGDTVVSVLALALAGGADIRCAAVLANCAGAAVVRKVGVATVTADEIRSLLDEGGRK